MEEDDCPTIWELDKHELTTSAKVESGRLTLEARNPTSSEAIELKQEVLEGDFELSLAMVSMEWDSLVIPQFRLEVYSVEDSTQTVSGVAINHNAFYCYVDAASGNSAMRLISEHSGSMTIKKENGIISCSGSFGDVNLMLADTLDETEMGVRLVLGSSASSTGKVTVVLDDLAVSGSQPVLSDSFDCQSW